MAISPRTDQLLHKKLPIDQDEKILAIFRHHWFAYASIWISGGLVAVIALAIAFALTMFGDPAGATMQHREQIMAAAGAFAVLVLLGTALPVYLRSQEQMVLTDEALLQVLQPSLFASKTDQLGLQHISDVTVRQDFFGSIFGYGRITIETPGEQSNYEFSALPNPQAAARQIAEAHEDFTAALNAGRLPSTLGEAQLQLSAIDPQQYRQFLQYQQMLAQQQRDRQAAAGPASAGPAGTGSVGDGAGSDGDPRGTGNQANSPADGDSRTP